MQIPCQGHGQSPDAFAVNAAVFEIKRMMAYRPNDYIIVHCTHGFNRTGVQQAVAVRKLLCVRACVCVHVCVFVFVFVYACVRVCVCARGVGKVRGLQGERMLRESAGGPSGASS